MLDPDVVLSAIVSAFQSIPALVTEMAGNAANISGHDFSYGEENSLIRTVYSMQSPSILIAYLDLLGGNFDGSTIWKHRLEAYIRPKNAASGTNNASPGHLWWLMMNRPILSTTQNIRQTSLLSGALMLMDTPTLVHKQDEIGMDFFVGTMVFPEYGDN